MFTWLIFAYFMIRGMELKSDASNNKRELTMDMIRFFATVAGYFILLIMTMVLNDRRYLQRETTKNLAILISVIAIPYIFIFNAMLCV